MDPFKTLVRISIDGGGSFLKVIVNVFNPAEESGKFINSGVQRCQILVITEDVPESNFNLKQVLEKLNLEDVEFSLAFDLKCANAVLGCLHMLEKEPVSGVKGWQHQNQGT